MDARRQVGLALALLLVSGCATARQAAVPAVCAACASLAHYGLCGAAVRSESAPEYPAKPVCPEGQRLFVTNLDRLARGERVKLECK
jgi:hypothetical protein